MELVLAVMLITAGVLGFIFYGFKKLWDVLIETESRKWDRDV